MSSFGVTDDSFPKWGVYIETFDFFIDKCGGTYALAGLTTDDVCKQFVLPFTKSNDSEYAETSYCQYLMVAHPELVSNHATVFVSHAWRGLFLEAVAAIQEFARQAEQADDTALVFWFDLFSNDQHNAVSRPFEWWTTTFKEAILTFGHTLVVLEPWRRPIAFMRCWCLFELYTTISNGCLLDVAIIPSELTKMRTDLCTDYHKFLKFLAAVDLRNAEATNPADKARIFEVIETTSSFTTLNETVIGGMRVWMRRYFRDCINADIGRGVDELLLVGERNALAVMSKTQGCYDEAIEVWTAQLAVCRERLGDEHATTLATWNNIAAVHRLQQHFDTAEDIFKTILDIRTRTLGQQHVNTLNTLNSFGLLYRDAGRLNEALPLLEQCLETRLELFTLQHEDTLKSLHNLASTQALCSDLSLQNTAETTLRECIEQRTVLLGAQHPNTLDSKMQLGNLYLKQGRLRQALELLSTVEVDRREKLGTEDATAVRLRETVESLNMQLSCDR